MNEFAGIERKTRSQLSEILQKIHSTVTVEEAANILKLPRLKVAKLMARWVKQGWLTRIRRGLYSPVPLDARAPDSVVEDPWIVATRVFKPSYVGGWSAAEHWGFTEQIFRTIIIMTTRTVANRKPKIQATEFWIKKIASSRFFGTKVIWKGSVQILISDPTKTVIDMLDDPLIAGGARMTGEVLKEYWNSPHKDITRIFEYADRMKNGAIYKRLGFLLERFKLVDESVLSKIKKRLSSGNAKFDSSLNNNKLVTRWRLLVPQNWEIKK